MIARIWAHLTAGVTGRAYNRGFKDGHEDGINLHRRRAANICLVSQGSTERERDYARRRVT